MEYRYDIENDVFYKLIISDHELTEEEKQAVKRTACQEEVAGEFLSKKNVFYKYDLPVLPGVRAAFQDKLIWDDLRDYMDTETVTTSPTEEFNRDVEEMMKDTSIVMQRKS